MEPKELNKFVNKILTEQVAQIIKNESKPKYFHIIMGEEPIETCDSKNIAIKKLGDYKKAHPNEKLKIKPSNSKTYDEVIDELDEITDNLEESDMKKTRKIYALTEAQVTKVIDSLIAEDVPGVRVTDMAKSGSKRVNKEYAKEVAAKMKKALNFSGNDNPEFPKPIGKGEKVARRNSSAEQDEIDSNENRTPLEAEYDSEPSEQFKERAKKAIEGDSTMGNGVEPGTNAVNGSAAKTIQDVSKKKMKAQAEEPLYKKEEVPVDNVKHMHDDKKHGALNESVNKEVARLKELYNYNKKTQ